jgi:polar amino acid transport system substrate-binding protein
LGISQTKRNLAGLACAGLLSSLTWAQVATDISKEIAPSGTLRAVINLGNPILARKDNINGEPIGLSVDLAKELAKKFHLPLKLLAVESAAAAVEAVIVGDADLGFFAIDPVRGKGITFTPPYLLIEGSYLVKNDSPLLNTSQVDQA